MKCRGKVATGRTVRGLFMLLSDSGSGGRTARIRGPGNLRVDYILPSADLVVTGGGVSLDLDLK